MAKAITKEDRARRQKEAEEFDRAFAWYKEHRTELLLQHEGLYVAILEGKEDQARRQKEAEEFDRAFAWYKEHRNELLLQHEGLYVAILEGEVVDSDQSIEALVGRIYARYRHRDFFTAKVEAVEKVHRISPRLVRS